MSSHRDKVDKTSRRNILRIGMASAVGLPFVAGTGLTAEQPRTSTTGARRSSGKTRNIIFLVADGMSTGVPTLAEPFSQMVRGRSTNWHRLATDPQRTSFGHFDMASADSLVTDSAAAASAWGCGVRINNGAVNMLPDGTELASIGPLAHDAGRRAGLVTTTRVTHATPAGFGASVPRRGMEDEIAEQYLGKFDVIMGGGLGHFEADRRRDGRDLLAEYRAGGYAVLQTRGDLAGHTANEDRIIGLFYGSHLPYTIDHMRDETLRRDVPTLAEMTRVALKRLVGRGEGFILQVEGGRVDHAAHGTDAGAIMWDQLAFDDAIGVCMEFQQDHPETLIIITTDHGNANPGLNGIGGGYRGSNDAFARLMRFRASLGDISSRIRSATRSEGGELTADTVKEAVKWGTQIEITDDEADVIVGARTGRPIHEMNHQLATWRGQMAQILGNHTGIQWVGRSHTADWAMLMATGPGREQFSGLLLNTDAYDRMAQHLGITHKNPQMPEDENGEQRRRGIMGMRQPADDVDEHWM